MRASLTSPSPLFRSTSSTCTDANSICPMPRLTFIRLLKSVLVLWLSLVGFWLFLPFPVHDSAVQKTLIQRLLRSGYPIRTVLAYHSSFLAPRDTPRWQLSGCSSAIVIDWKLISDRIHDSITLQIGESFSLNLTELVIKDHLKRRESHLSLSEHPSVTWTDELSVRVRSGAAGQIYDPWWFHYADAVLFDEQMWGGDYCDLDLKFLVTAMHQVEVFKASTFYSYDDMTDKYYLRNPPITPARPVRPRERDQGHLATFSNLPTGLDIDSILRFHKVTAKIRGGTSNVGVSNIAGSLPSKTYPIRRLLVMGLAPSFVLIHAIGDQITRWHSLWAVILAVCALLISLAWLVAGRPRPVLSWLRRGNWWLFGDSNARRRKQRFEIP